MPEKPTTPKKPHRLMVALPAASAALLRETTGITSYTQSELLAAIEKSRQFESAVEQVLQAMYLERLKQGERLFKKTGANDPIGGVALGGIVQRKQSEPTEGR